MAVAVEPLRARLELKRDLGQLIAPVLQALQCPSIVRRHPAQPRTLDERDETALSLSIGLVAQHRAIAEARGVSQQMKQRDRPLHGLELPTMPVDLGTGKGGYVLRERVLQFQLAVLQADGNGHGDDRLGHRIELYDAVRSHGDLALHIRIAKAVHVSERSMPVDDVDDAGELTAPHLRMQRRVDLPQLLRIEAGLLGPALGAPQRGKGGFRCRGDDGRRRLGQRGCGRRPANQRRRRHRCGIERCSHRTCGAGSGGLRYQRGCGFGVALEGARDTGLDGDVI
mmetsp:Transcript_12174/g.30500  ORF Transcript_12174/g.30500 Transcript_12174/m.30500 type:complete len:283 (+) Transcript_12174:1680-2528(+)